MEELNMAIKALEQQESERWIPVSERLPECNMTVYVSARHVESTSDFVTEMKYDAYDERWKWGNGKYISDKYTVRAWHRKQYPKPYSE